MVDAAKDDTEFGARKLSGVPMGLCEALPRLVDAANAKAAAPPELSSEVDNSDDVLGHTAGLPWARRETFITALEKATIDGELRLWLRLPDGHRFDLTAAEWRATPFRREIVITGFWRDTLGGLARYDDMPVFVDEAAFEAWCGERASVRPETPVSAEPSQFVSTEPSPPVLTKPPGFSKVVWGVALVIYELIKTDPVFANVANPLGMRDKVNERLEASSGRTVEVRTIQRACDALRKAGVVLASTPKPSRKKKKKR